MFWIVVGAFVVIGIAALFLTAPKSDKAAKSKAASAPVYADVEVGGASLSDWSGSGTDPAIGKVVPTLTGIDFDKVKQTIPVPGKPTVAMVVAHWCPHCNAEVPRIVKWQTAAKTKGVEFIALSTAADKGQPNYPPAVWLADEKWPFKAFIDDEAGTGAGALGVQGYPFIVFIDGDGKVVQRYSGEMPIKEFEQAVKKLQGS